MDTALLVLAIAGMLGIVLLLVTRLRARLPRSETNLFIVLGIGIAATGAVLVAVAGVSMIGVVILGLALIGLGMLRDRRRSGR